MSLSASWPAAEFQEESAAFERRSKAFAAARRHSRLVRTLRVLLPGSAVLAMIAAIAIGRFALPADIDLSMAQLSVTRNAIIMQSPRLTGFSGDQREYSVTAERAVQPLTSPDQVRLETIEARFVAAENRATVLTAASGEYDHSEGTLRLAGSIAVDTSDGYAIRMTGADIDFRAGMLLSEGPVTVRYHDSAITADAISISENGKLMVFEGNVRTTLMPPKHSAPPPAE
jgi:lipopolysaccharide export system protein LptC